MWSYLQNLKLDTTNWDKGNSEDDTVIEEPDKDKKDEQEESEQEEKDD